MSLLIRQLWVVALLLCSVSVNAIVPLEAYGQLEQINNVSISPSGNLIAYRSTESDDKDFLVVHSLKEKKSIAMLSLEGIDPRSHYFVNDNQLILQASAYLDWREFRRGFDISTSFIFDIKKNKLKQLLVLGRGLTGGRSVTLGQTGAGRIVGKSTDGKWLFTPAYVSDGKYDHLPDYSLLKVKADGDGIPRIVSRGTPQTRKYFLGDKGQILARENLNEKTNIHSIDGYYDDKWQTLYSYESTIPTHSFVGLTSDFSGLVFSKDEAPGVYLTLSLADGSIKPLTELNTEAGSGYLLTNHQNVVVGVASKGFSPQYKMLDRKLEKRIQHITSGFEGHSVYLSSWSQDWKDIVVRVEGSQYAGDYFLFREGKEPAFLLKSRKNIATTDINFIATAKIKARDGLPIPTILTIPRSKVSNVKNLPTIVFPHGGPASHDQIGFDYLAQALASRGYLVIQPQFRGSTGFGRELHDAGLGQWGKGMQTDLIDALKAFAKAGYVDPDKVCIVGASYGGYAALAGATFSPEQYQCAVSIAGISHLPKLLKSTKSRFGKNSWHLDYWKQVTLNGDYEESSLKALSPYYSADKVQIPVLLIHGEDDTVVKFNQSELMFEALQDKQKDVQLVTLEDDDHYLREGSTRIQAVKAVVEFVEQHIGG